MFRTIRLVNYKSVQNQTIDFDPLTVLVGKNAVGKSVLFSALFFLHQLSLYGLDEAVRYQRGWLSLVNQINLKNNSDNVTTLLVSVSTDDIQDDRHEPSGPEELFRLKGSLTYTFEADFPPLQSGSLSFSDASFSPCEIREAIAVPVMSAQGEEIVTVSQKVPYNQGYPRWDQANATWQGDRELLTETQKAFLDHFLAGSTRSFPDPLRLLIGRSMLIAPSLYGAFRSIAWYDFQPTVIRQAFPPDLVAFNDRWGWDTAHKIEKLARNPDVYHQFVELLREIVPTIKDFRTKSLEDRSLLLWATEEFGWSRERTTSIQLPASGLSDGTLYAAALVNALHFEFPAIRMLEEPERYVHPGVLPVVAEWARNVAEIKHRVLISTHSTDLLAALPLNAVVHVRRNSEGFTEFYPVRPESPDERQRIARDLDDVRGYQRMDAWDAWA